MVIQEACAVQHIASMRLEHPHAPLACSGKLELPYVMHDASCEIAYTNRVWTMTSRCYQNSASAVITVSEADREEKLPGNSAETQACKQFPLVVKVVFVGFSWKPCQKARGMARGWLACIFPEQLVFNAGLWPSGFSRLDDQIVQSQTNVKTSAANNFSHQCIM